MKIHPLPSTQSLLKNGNGVWEGKTNFGNSMRITLSWKWVQYYSPWEIKHGTTAGRGVQSSKDASWDQRATRPARSHKKESQPALGTRKVTGEALADPMQACQSWHTHASQERAQIEQVSALSGWQPSVGNRKQPSPEHNSSHWPLHLALILCSPNFLLRVHLSSSSAWLQRESPVAILFVTTPWLTFVHQPHELGHWVCP